MTMSILHKWSQAQIDEMKQMIETFSGGLNTIIQDDYGYPNVMYRFKQYRPEVIDLSLATPGQVLSNTLLGTDPGRAGVHPAFIVRNREIKEIYVSKYLNAIAHTSDILTGVPVSLPGQIPYTLSSGQNKADLVANAARRKGRGWAPMTNATWAAIALKVYRDVLTGRQEWPGGNGFWGCYLPREGDSETHQADNTQGGNAYAIQETYPYSSEEGIRSERFGQAGIND